MIKGCPRGKQCCRGNNLNKEKAHDILGLKFTDRPSVRIERLSGFLLTDSIDLFVLCCIAAAKIGPPPKMLAQSSQIKKAVVHMRTIGGVRP